MEDPILSDSANLDTDDDIVELTPLAKHVPHEIFDSLNDKEAKVLTTVNRSSRKSEKIFHKRSSKYKTTVNLKKSFKCNFCQKSFRNNNDVIIHMKSHGFIQDETLVPCAQCNKYLPRQDKHGVCSVCKVKQAPGDSDSSFNRTLVPKTLPSLAPKPAPIPVPMSLTIVVQYPMPVPMVAPTKKGARLVPLRPKSTTNEAGSVPKTTQSSTIKGARSVPKTAQSSTIKGAGSLRSVPRSTLWYWRQKQKKMAAGEYVRQSKVRRQNRTYTCSKCGHLRTADSQHRQYFGEWYCPSTDMESLEEWLSLRKKRRKEAKMQKMQQSE